MPLRRFRPFAMLLCGMTIFGLITVTPDALPPEAVAGLLLTSLGLLAGGLRRGAADSVSA